MGDKADKMECSTVSPEISPDGADQTAALARVGISLKDGVEWRGGRAVCTVEDALRLLAEYKRLFTDSSVGIIPHEFVGREGEERLDHAYEVVKVAIRADMERDHGVAIDTPLCNLPEELKGRFIDWLCGTTRPNVVCAFGGYGFTGVEALLAVVDDKEDPYGKLFLRTAIADLRIDLGKFLARLSQHTGLRDFFPFHYPESGEMREAFRRLIDQLLREIGLPEAGPGFAVIHMGGGDQRELPAGVSRKTLLGK